MNLTVMSEFTCLWLSLCPHNHHHIGVPLDDKVIFQSEGSFLIWEMLTKFSEFFWRFIISRQNLYLSASGSVSFVEIHGEFFYYVDSTSYIGFFCITFNFSMGQTFTTVVRIFSNLHFLILSGVWLLDFKCFEILCRLMVSFALSISQACLRVSLAAWPADIESIQIHQEDPLSKIYHLCHKQSHPLWKSHREIQIHILNQVFSVL